ncbi:MAG: PadR family transcriptional regulator [bacterium]
MSLRFAVIGLLRIHEMSGYDLSQVFDHSIRYYWKTEHTQIYRVLSSLADRGWIEPRIEEQESRPDRKVYRVTTEGDAAFRAWREAVLPLPEIRHAHLLQFSFMSEIPTERIRAFLTSYAAQIRERLALYQDPDHINQTQQYARSRRESAIWRLVLENGVHYYEHELRWCEHALRTLEGESEDDRP